LQACGVFPRSPRKTKAQKEKRLENDKRAAGLRVFSTSARCRIIVFK
jgi:hypothetical protein